MSWDELLAKLRAIAVPRIGTGDTQAMVDALTALREQLVLEPLLARLAM